MSEKRYRCGACGNLARFEVVMNRRVREIHHVGVDGTLVGHRSELISEATETVVCAWCADSDRVEVIAPVDGPR
ncbi:MAG: hypothetical protein AAGA93_02270 [Actinomycetota bacterium]